MGSGNAGSNSFFCVIAPVHGGRSEVMYTRPDRIPANDSPVRPAINESAPFGTGFITPLLASGTSHRLAKALGLVTRNRF